MFKYDRCILAENVTYVVTLVLILKHNLLLINLRTNNIHSITTFCLFLLHQKDITTFKNLFL